MNKKVYLGLSVLATLFAADAMAHTGGKPNTGVSLGIQGGYLTHNGDLNTNTVLLNSNNSTDLQGTSGSIGLFLSYGMMLNHYFYTGLEVFGQYQDAQGQQKNVSTADTILTVTAKMKESYGGALKLGVLFKKDILTYVKLGAVSTKFDLTTSNPPRNQVSNSTRKTGFLAGLGAQVPISHNWFIGAEWAYTWYGNVSINSVDSNQNSTYKPRTNNISLRLGYTF